MNKPDKHHQDKKPLRVAIIAELLVKMGGAERVVKKLAEMYPEAPIYTLLYDEDKCGQEFPAERVRPSFLQRLPKFIRRRYRWLLPLMPYAIESFDLGEFDLVISSSSAFAHGALTNSDSVHICYCHTPMRYAWDYAHEYLNDKWFNPWKRWLARRTMEKIRLWDKVSADRADFYIANSEHVRRRIVKYYRLPAEVIYPPVETDKIKLSENDGDYFLIVATLTAYKKIDLAINLFNKTGKKLVIVGEGPERCFLENMAAKNIQFKGRLTDVEMREVLDGCRAFIFPSEEDFGITMIEALAAGKPVLAYQAGGALEFIKPGVNGEFFEEQTLASMEDGLGRLILQEKKYSKAKMRQEAEKFSSEQFERNFRKMVEAKLK